MKSTLVGMVMGIGMSASVFIIGCSNTIGPANLGSASHVPTLSDLGGGSSGVRLTGVPEAAPADGATAPGLTYAENSSPLHIHMSDRGTVEGRIKIAVVRADTEAKTVERLRSIAHLERALDHSGTVDVDIEVGRAQPFNAIATDAHMLLVAAGPGGRRAERFAKELERYAVGGGLIVGSVPRALSAKGTWLELAPDHPLLTTPYRIETRRRDRRTSALVVNGRLIAVSGAYATASGGRFTGDEVKRWANLLAFAAGPRHGGRSLSRIPAADGYNDSASVDAPSYLGALTSTPKGLPTTR